MKSWQRWTTGWVAGGLLVALARRILGQPLMVIGNLLFMVGLALVLFGLICVLAKGHMFTGWRHKRKKGQEPLPGEKVDVRHVASVKNSPIVVNGGARFGLLAGAIYIVFGVILTLF